MTATCCVPPFASERFLASLDQLFAQALMENTFSGASLLVAKPDLILLHKTWGHTHHGGGAIDAHTLFDLASLTKPLVPAPLCMRAISEGKFALDDTLRLFFSADLLAAEKKAITIRQLLSHSSGLPAYKPFYLELIALEPSMRQDVLVERILRTPLKSDPGAASCYSDLGYMLLTTVLEGVYGKPIDHLASEFLFEPLGLNLAGSSSEYRTLAPVSDPACFSVHAEGSKHEGPEHEGSKHEGSKHEGSKHEGPKHEGPEEVSNESLNPVTPAKAGVQKTSKNLDSGFRRNDIKRFAAACLTTSSTASLTTSSTASSTLSKENSIDGALGFCRLRVPSDPTKPSEKLTAVRRAFAATEACPWRNRLLAGEVHDENAYCLGGVAGHAGLFGTAHGIFGLLVFLWNVFRGTISHHSWKAEVAEEFWTKTGAPANAPWMLGYDTPSLQDSSAGNHFSPRSLGHLGFTGTSFWFDLDQEILIILLTNRVYPTRENERLKSFRPVVHNLVMETYHGLSRC